MGLSAREKSGVRLSAGKRESMRAQATIAGLAFGLVGEEEGITKTFYFSKNSNQNEFKFKLEFS